MIVVDASAAVAALLHPGTARDAIANDRLIAPHLIDVEIASTLRRLTLGGALPASACWARP